MVHRMVRGAQKDHLMPLTDSPQCRALLSHLFPTLDIEANLRPSGQRLVYFCRFRNDIAGAPRADWADTRQPDPTMLKFIDVQKGTGEGFPVEHDPRLACIIQVP